MSRLRGEKKAETRKGYIVQTEAFPGVLENPTNRQFEPFLEKFSSSRYGRAGIVLLAVRYGYRSFVFKYELPHSKLIRSSVPYKYRHDDKSFEQSFAKSVINIGRPAGVSRRYPLVWTEKNPVSAMTHQRSKVCPKSWTILDFCRGTGSLANAYLLAQPFLELFRCDTDDSCTFNPMSLILERFERQMLNLDCDTINTGKFWELSTWLLPKEK